MAGSTTYIRRGTVPPELANYEAPRDIGYRNAWVDEINANREREPLRISGNLPIDQYVYGLEFLVLELEKRVRALEAKQ